jgi:hypothetical protein
MSAPIEHIRIDVIEEYRAFRFGHRSLHQAFLPEMIGNDDMIGEVA